MENPRKALISSTLVSHVGGGPSPLWEARRHSAAYLLVSVTMTFMSCSGNNSKKASTGLLLRGNVGPTLSVNSFTVISVAVSLHCCSSPSAACVVPPCRLVALLPWPLPLPRPLRLLPRLRPLPLIGDREREHDGDTDGDCERICGGEKDDLRERDGVECGVPGVALLSLKASIIVSITVGS